MYRILLAVLTLLTLVPAGRADILTPAGLQPGDLFRIVFLSSTTTTATSSDSGDYDAVIHADAVAAGIGEYEGEPLIWQAIVTTPTLDAVTRLPRDNVPLYLPHLPSTTLPHTQMVAAGGDQLWSTESVELLHTINMFADGREVEVGGVTQPVWVWTGAAPDGTTDLARNTLGNDFGRSLVGLAQARDGNWINATIQPQTERRPLYGFSNVLVVGTGSPAPVPEPGTITLALVGLGGLVGARRWRRGREASPSPPAGKHKGDIQDK